MLLKIIDVIDVDKNSIELALQSDLKILKLRSKTFHPCYDQILRL